MTDGAKSFDELVAVLLRHLPDWGDEANCREADALMRAIAPVEAHIAVWKPKEETQRLERIRHLIGELQIEWDELHPRLQGAVLTGCALSDPDPKDPQKVGLNREAMAAAENLDKMVRLIGPGIAKATQEAEIGVAKRSDWNFEAASLVEECRNIWERRTGKIAPTRPNAATRFGRFLSDVLEAFEVQATPDTAMRAWLSYWDDWKPPA